MLSSATKKKIDTARDMLVGKIPMPTSQVEQITLALIYKFMSDMDKKTKELGDTSGFFANGYEKYAWDHLMDKSMPARDRVLLYREALEKMALNPHIPQLFRDIFRNASLPFNDPETLKMFLEVINQFEYDHSEELGNAFEYLLQVMGSQGDAGQFRTPRHIIDFIVEVVDPKKTDKILDPACGTAGFLISAYNHLRKNGLTNDEMDQVSANFVGYDISQDMQRLSLVNMYLHHFPDPHIYEYDSLSSEDRWNDDFDVILANPPFMTPKGGIRPHNRFSVPSNRAEVLFVDYIMEHLTINGKAGVIVPEGIIFQSQNAYKALRKMMVDDDFLWAVVSLPAGVFQPYSGVKTSILFFDRQLAKKTNKILFVKAGSDGFDLGAQRREIKQNDLPKALEILNEYKKQLVDDILPHVENTNITSLVDKEEIKKFGYNLSGEKLINKQKISSEEFRIDALSNLVELVRGVTYSKSDEVEIGGHRILRANNISISGRLILDDIKNVSESLTLNQSKKLIKNDVFICLASGSKDHIGKVAFIEDHTDYYFGGFMGAVRVKHLEILLPKYLFYLLNSVQFNQYLRDQISGANINNLNQTILGNFQIPIPPLSKQQDIIEELDRYQQVIDGAKQVIKNHEISFKIKSDWSEIELGKICEFKNGLNFTKSSSGKEISVVGVKDFKDRLFAPIHDLGTVQIDGDIGSGFLLKTHDILFVRSNGNQDLVGRSIILPTVENEISFSGFTIRARVIDDQINPLYLAYLFKTRLFREKMKSLGRGANIRNLNQEMLSQLTVPVPTLEDQETIVSTLALEKDVISQFKQMVDLYESKIKARIDEIWGK